MHISVDAIGDASVGEIMEKEIPTLYSPPGMLDWPCGVERLSNGNTLITESDPGRAFEVTAEKQIVWEYINPHRAGENNENIATLLEVVRLNRDFPTDWLTENITR